uniref:Uncharacterized protein n=1 Tax=Cacopsylla melanoneura TaxID=428564 RepID=A0A8D8V9F0_9HEMI
MLARYPLFKSASITVTLKMPRYPLFKSASRTITIKMPRYSLFKIASRTVTMKMPRYSRVPLFKSSTRTKQFSSQEPLGLSACYWSRNYSAVVHKSANSFSSFETENQKV